MSTPRCPSSFWPDSKAGAVSLTFDDGLSTQLDYALPLLDRAGLPGTFYVNPGRSTEWEANVPRWRAAAAAGHEIGNHTTRHPCSCNFHFDPVFCLEKLTLEDIAETVDAAETELNRLFPQQRDSHSFCYPCYQTYVGAGERRQSYVPLIARRFAAGRGWGERPNDPCVVDLACVGSLAVDGHSASVMIDYIEAAADQGYWAVICIHGIGGQHISISREAFAGVVDHLEAHPNRLWTATLHDVAAYVLGHRPCI